MRTKFPHLPYEREAYRLWFEYLKLAHSSADKEVKRALAARAKFYEPWGDVVNVRFDDWWRDHGHLFEERRQVRRLARRQAPSDPDAIAIEVPLTPSMLTIMRQVRAVVREAREGRVRGARRTRPAATYRLTEGAEPRFRALRDSLTVYREVYLRCLKELKPQGKEPRGKMLLDAAHAFYAGRKRMKLPSPLRIPPSGDPTVAMRNLRRYIQRAQRIMLNVARGEFPGRE